MSATVLFATSERFVEFEQTFCRLNSSYLSDSLDSTNNFVC
jgi:hypothetical protein